MLGAVGHNLHITAALYPKLRGARMAVPHVAWRANGPPDPLPLLPSPLWQMGLGKTVQVMSLIAYLMEKKQNFGPHLIIVPNAGGWLEVRLAVFVDRGGQAELWAAPRHCAHRGCVPNPCDEALTADAPARRWAASHSCLAGWVCPASCCCPLVSSSTHPPCLPPVIVNWKSELTQWLPAARCVYYVGNKVGWARVCSSLQRVCVSLPAGWRVHHVGNKVGN